jgi:hypothetical protein
MDTEIYEQPQIGPLVQHLITISKEEQPLLEIITGRKKKKRLHVRLVPEYCHVIQNGRRIIVSVRCGESRHFNLIWSVNNRPWEAFKQRQLLNRVIGPPMYSMA